MVFGNMRTSVHTFGLGVYLFPACDSYPWAELHLLEWVMRMAQSANAALLPKLRTAF
jgi:hypothetical protein